MMLLLDSGIAKQIVERTMQTLGYNINVMNSSGVILGSGNPERIGSIHEGALLAISQNRTVEIDENSQHCLQGVKPGINLPLHHQGRIIGVIGITGDPKELRQFGQLLKMTAEMMVEQTHVLEQSQWHKRQQEELVLQLIKEDSNNSPHLQQWANSLRIDLQQPRVVSLIEFNNAGDDQYNLRDIQQLLDYPQRNNLVAMSAMNELVILKPVELEQGHWSADKEEKRIDQLLQRLPKTYLSGLKIALGHYVAGPHSLPRSYQSAKQTLELGKKLAPQDNKYLYRDYALPVLLADFADDWRGKELLQPYQRLLDTDKQGVLTKTLRGYFAHFGDLSQCAQSLYIHRNTLRYRLDKIKEITDLDLNNLESVVKLYLASILNSDHKNDH